MNPVLEELRKQVEETTAVVGSAVTLIDGIGGRIEAAVAAAIANGATAEQLAPVSAEVAVLKESSDALGAAVAANTPPPATENP